MNEQTAADEFGSQTEAVALWVNPRRFDPFVRRFYRLAAVWKTENGPPLEPYGKMRSCSLPFDRGDGPRSNPAHSRRVGK